MKWVYFVLNAKNYYSAARELLHLLATIASIDANHAQRVFDAFSWSWPPLKAIATRRGNGGWRRDVRTGYTHLIVALLEHGAFLLFTCCE